MAIQLTRILQYDTLICRRMKKTIYSFINPPGLPSMRQPLRFKARRIIRFTLDKKSFFTYNYSICFKTEVKGEFQKWQ